MFPRDELLRVLENAPLTEFEGWVYRIVAEKYRDAPIELIGSFLAGGRFNLQGQFGVLYTGDSRETALTEVQQYFENDPRLKGVPRNPELLLSLRCKLFRVLDLTDPTIAHMLGTSREELVVPRFIAEARNEVDVGSRLTTKLQLTPTQELGLACFRSKKVSGLKAPSAACSAKNQDGFCINMLFDNFIPGESVEVYDTTGRIMQSKRAGD